MADTITDTTKASEEDTEVDTVVAMETPTEDMATTKSKRLQQSHRTHEQGFFTTFAYRISF